MKKGFLILLFLLPQLALSQQKDNLSPKLIELGFRMNMPFVAMNYHICDAKLYKQPYRQKTMELTNEWIEAGYDVLGLYFSAGVNFTKNWQLEFRYGKLFNQYRPPASGLGWTTVVGFILKRYSSNRKFYWAILTYVNNFYVVMSGTRSLYGLVGKDKWKELPGVGFGIKIWKGLYLEASLHGVIGDKSLYETVEDKALYDEHKKVRLIGFGSVNIGYSLGVLKR